MHASSINLNKLMKKFAILFLSVFLFFICNQCFVNQFKNIDLYFINGYEYKKPSGTCRTSACQALLNEINSAQKSISFAIYGIANQPEIFNALINAQKRGVIVRGVTDMTENNTNYYSDTELLMQQLGTIKTDFDIADKNVKEFKNKFAITSAIMHNKFFVFDEKKVWTGSCNICGTGTGGYNTNTVLVIDSPSIAKLYTEEFNQMYNLQFHTIKQPIQRNTNIKINDETIVSVYFLPKHKVFKTDLHNLLTNAQKSIYVEMFYLTNRGLVDDLIAAKLRGVDVKVIIDATSARNRYSGHKRLRESGIPVKTENWGGKMHSKAATIDEKYYVLGSMNWTGKAELHNDENLVILNSSTIATKTKEHFGELWNVIPDKYLTYDPAPEGPASKGSCFDGIDNDYDDYVDMEDYGCSWYKNKK